MTIIENEKKPEVSVILPAFNCENTIRYSINSVIEQTFSDWELLIVDDKSSDQTAKTITEFSAQEQRIKFFRNDQNKGASESRNKAIEHASGRYICFLDSDDYWHPEKLELQLNFMRDNNVTFSYHDYMIVDSTGTPMKQIVCPPDFNLRSYLKNNKIGVLTIMIDSHSAGKPFMFNQPVAATVGTWLTLLRSGHTAKKSPSGQAYYRISPNSLSRNKLRSRYWYWRALRDILGMNAILATYYTIVSSFNAIIKNNTGRKR